MGVIRRTLAVVLVVGLAVVSVLYVSCDGVDNSIVLADAVAAAAAQGSDGGTVAYEPLAGAATPFTVIFFPERDVPERELVAAGVASEIAERIYTELAYLGGMAGLAVVEQEGQRLSFTSSWKRHARVQDLVVSPRKTGPARIEVRREHGIVRIVAVR